MTRRRLGIIAAVAAVALLLTFGIVWLVRNYKPTPEARPCFVPPVASAMETLRGYTNTVSNAKTIADEVDVVCVLEETGPTTVAMRYYEDDDGFADFVPYALLTAHARQLANHQKVTGNPDDGQRLAAFFLMGVRADGTFYPVYKHQGANWNRDDHPVSNPGALVTQVRYGSAAAIPVKKAFSQAAPSKYRKGTLRLSNGTGTTSFESIRTPALNVSGKDDDHRTTRTTRPSSRPSSTPSANTGPGRRTTPRPGTTATSSNGRPIWPN